MKPLSVSEPQRIVVLITLFVAVLSACSRSQDESLDLQTMDGFVDSLKSAGATVSEDTAIEREPMGVIGKILHVNDRQIEVFEYPTLDERLKLSAEISLENDTIADSPMPWTDSPTIWATGKLIIVHAGHDGGTILLISGLVGDPLTYRAPERDEPYPPAIVEAIRFLAEQIEVNPAVIQVDQFEEVEWPDSCLGAPNPDEMCAQVISTGWRITLSVNDIIYKLRTDDIGTQIRMP